MSSTSSPRHIHTHTHTHTHDYLIRVHYTFQVISKTFQVCSSSSVQKTKGKLASVHSCRVENLHLPSYVFTLGYKHESNKMMSNALHHLYVPWKHPIYVCTFNSTWITYWLAFKSYDSLVHDLRVSCLYHYIPYAHAINICSNTAMYTYINKDHWFPNFITSCSFYSNVNNKIILFLWRKIEQFSYGIYICPYRETPETLLFDFKLSTTILSPH